MKKQQNGQPAEQIGVKMNEFNAQLTSYYWYEMM